VVDIRRFEASRNHSDTLDYSDYRTTMVTEALVYVGRKAPKYDWMDAGEMNPIVEKELSDRFKWVDCTNLFTWRGSDHREPTIDVTWGCREHEDCTDHPELAAACFNAKNAEMVEDYAAWKAHVDEKERLRQEAQIANDTARILAQAEAEKNRPVKGKKMIVVKGRKVPVGTTGVVAHISDTSVLLKDEKSWQDRKAPGIWVSTANLRAV
jgi:hypothetical protein